MPDERASSSPPNLLPMIRPVIEPDDELMNTLRASLVSGQVTNNGPLVQRFERAAAAWLGVPEVVAVSTGADGLLLSLQALGLRGKVVLPSFTYFATLSAVLLNGLEPVFCDVDAHTFTLDPAALAQVLAREKGVAAVLPVNVYGVPPDLSALAELAAGAGALLAYDNAHGFGTEQDGRRLPSEPAFQMLSLHATKVMPAVEGGLVASPDAGLLAQVRRLRAHGIAADPFASTPGRNAKMDEMRAAVALHSLGRFDDALVRRRAYAARLRQTLMGCEGLFEVQRVPAGVISNFQNLAVRVVAEPDVTADALVAAFARHGVEARRYFHPPLHRLAMIPNPPTLPRTDALSASLVCLPIYSRMTEDELACVEHAVMAVARDLSHSPRVSRVSRRPRPQRTTGKGRELKVGWRTS